MSSRLLAFLFTIALLWSGLGPSAEARMLAEASPEPGLTQCQVGEANAGPPGALACHDATAQAALAAIDVPSEPPGLPVTPVTPPSRSPRMAQPGTWVSGPAGSPCLAGPLRPPCRAALVG